MASKASIATLALHRIGISQLISNVDTEASQQALSIKAIYNDARDAVLREFSWPFATRYFTLGLVAGTAAVPVNPDWTFSYRYPPDCLFARRLVTAEGIQPKKPPAWRVGRDDQGRLLYTRESPACLEYTSRITNPEEFDPLFVSLLAWRIAWIVAPSLTRIEGVTDRAFTMMTIERNRAQGGAANEGQTPAPLEADWTSDR